MILTRDHDYQVKHENVQVLHSKAEVLQLAKDSEQPVYIAGGAEVYQLFEPYYDRLLKTVITGDFAGDAYFPKIDCSPYELVSNIAGVQDEKTSILSVLRPGSGNLSEKKQRDPLIKRIPAVLLLDIGLSPFYWMP